LFFEALINDWASSVPPDIYSFTPFIYNITVAGDQIEVLIPCNQGNWIDCSNGKDQQSAENSINKLWVLNKIYFFTCLRLYIIMCKKICINLSITIFGILSKSYTNGFNN